MYNGEVEVEQAALAPLAVLAYRLGLPELIESCTKAIISQCVPFLSLSLSLSPYIKMLRVEHFY